MRTKHIINLFLKEGGLYIAIIIMVAVLLSISPSIAQDKPDQLESIDRKFSDFEDKLDKLKEDFQKNIEQHVRTIKETSDKTLNSADKTLNSAAESVKIVGIIYSGIGILATVLVGILAFFGIREWKGLTKELRDLMKDTTKDVTKAKTDYEAFSRNLENYVSDLANTAQLLNLTNERLKNQVANLEAKFLIDRARQYSEREAIFHGLSIINSIIDSDNKVDPKIMAMAYNFKGYFLMILGSAQPAFDCFNEGLKLHRDEPNLLYNTACCAAVLGRKKEAFDYLRNSLDLVPEFRKLVINKENKLKDEDFMSIKDEPKFKSILGLPEEIVIEKYEPEIDPRIITQIANIHRKLERVDEK